MSQLVPCPSCDRHVRLPESSCPFCGGELNAQALGAKYASRRAPVPTGIKRAALMALSTVAAACGGKTDGTGDDTAPIVATETGDTLPVGTPVYGAPPVTSEVAAVTSDDGPSGTLVAIYGVDVPEVGRRLLNDEPAGVLTGRWDQHSARAPWAREECTLRRSSFRAIATPINVVGVCRPWHDGRSAAG